MTDSAICRLAEKTDTLQVKKLWSRCFDDTPAFVEWYFEHYYDSQNTIGIFEQDTLLASAQVIPYSIQLRNVSIDCGYVVGVDTAPEARNRGYARRLLGECLELQRQRSQPISLLMPFEGQFYYRYGWPFCYFHQQIKITPNELRCAAKPWGAVRQVALMDHKADLDRIYQSFTQAYSGFVQRTQDGWQRLLEDAALDETRCYLIEQDGQAEGYCLWTPMNDTVFIREMAWCHAEARAGLLQFLMGQVPEGKTLWLELPDDDTLVYELAAAKTSVVRYPFLMARIVDVKQCLEMLAYPPEQNVSIQMQLQDEFASWNTGCFQIAVEDGKVHVEKIAETVPEPDVVSTIEGLSQLVMGARSAEELSRQGVLKADGAVLDVLQTLWPKQALYINEYY